MGITQHIMSISKHTSRSPMSAPALTALVLLGSVIGSAEARTCGYDIYGRYRCRGLYNRTVAARERRTRHTPTTRPTLRTINTRGTCSRPAQATTPSPLQEDTPSPRARTTASNSRTRTRTPTEAVNTASGSSPTASSTPPRTPHRPFPHTHQRQLTTPTLAMAPSLLPPVRLLRLLARRVKPASTTSPRTGPVTMPSNAAGLSRPTRL